jgi:hypothetical protein
MVNYRRVELLAHPLSQKYLEMKWNSYGKYFHLVTLLVYCVYLTFITIFSTSLMNNTNIAKEKRSTNSTMDPHKISLLFLPISRKDVYTPSLM